jgi:8-oxo-dGTP pyrophosphatase MutT (NUDIX family)
MTDERYPPDDASSAHAFVVRNGEMLTLRFASRGNWYLPGGFVEPGEGPAEAAVRETVEETGLHIEGPELLRAWEFADLGGRKIVRSRYLYVARAGAGAVRLSDEHTDYAWLTPGEYVRRNCSAAIEAALPPFASFIADMRHNCGLLETWLTEHGGAR